MQEHSKQSLHLLKILSKIIYNMRNKKRLSINKLAYEYGLEKSTLSVLEKGIREPKFLTLWKLSEALGIKLSELIKIIEDELDDDFTLIDM